MKALLYCTKSKPYLIESPEWIVSIGKPKYIVSKDKTYIDDLVRNGKIVAECDFEVEEITTRWGEFETEKYSELSLQDNSCLTHQELCTYFGKLRNMCGGSKHCGYAINIENLKIFNEPKELGDYMSGNDKELAAAKVFHNFFFNSYSQFAPQLTKAPKNMKIVSSDGYDKKVLIPVDSELMCKILNEECTIIVKKKILKGM